MFSKAQDSATYENGKTNKLAEEHEQAEHHRFLFKQALLNATYKNGKPFSKLTEEHEQAEHHRFKKDFLFKDKHIPKNVYVSRLIQHYLIIQALEKQLQKLQKVDESEISAFFELSYLGHLWRTPGIVKDLKFLEVSIKTIQKREIAKTTETYIADIKQLPPKILLAHFLLHVAGFMHGGAIIRSKFINPSNALTSYQIPVNQYDFTSAILSAKSSSALTLFNSMMEEIDTIALDEQEYEEIIGQCKGIYKSMSDMYDDLCDMHTYQLKLTGTSILVFSLCFVALVYGLKLLSDLINSTQELTYSSGTTLSQG